MMSETNNLNLPSGFTAVEYADGSDYTRELLDELSKDDAEVWLIKAPFGADLRALNGQKLKLDRTSRCKCENGASLKYEIAHHSNVTNELESSVMLIPDFDRGELKPCSARISGFLSIFEAVALPDIQYPPVVERTVPFPQKLSSCYVPFGADHPIETISRKRKNRKHVEISDDESTQKKKSKKTKHKDSNRVTHITEELPTLNKAKRSEYEASSVEDADGMLQTKEELMSPTSKKPKKRKVNTEDKCDEVMKTRPTKRAKIEDAYGILQTREELMIPTSKKHKKRKVNTEDECDEAMKTTKRAKIEKNCNDSTSEDRKNVVKIKEEKLSPVRKTKKSKKKESLTEDYCPDVEEGSHFHKKKSKGNIHSDKDSDGVAVIEINSSPVHKSNINISEDSDTNIKETKKLKKRKKEK